MYDFNDDGFITKEDIWLILSYVPLFEESVLVDEKEGKFKQGIGSFIKYEDRRDT